VIHGGGLARPQWAGDDEDLQGFAHTSMMPSDPEM
jgi:hypothetical protein